MYRKIKQKRILVITQCFSCGSWLCIEKVLEKLANYNNEILVLGLGNILHKNKQATYICVPYLRYDRWGFITAWSPIISFLWNMPLFILGIPLIVIYQPKIVISNGLTSGLSINPFIKLFKKRSVIMFHSYVGKLGESLQNFLKLLGRSVDLVVVNSKGSFQDINLIVNSDKIVINEHYADECFFESSLGHHSKHCFTLLYVGRLDRDKYCFPLIEVARRLKNDKEIAFIFVGTGEYASSIRRLEKSSSNIKYSGYVSDRLKLRQLYQESDIIWSFADETYLALPGVEALACGRPIIIPKVPALGTDKINGEINRDLIPSQIGWIIDPYKPNEVLELIVTVKNKGIAPKMSKQCREYAKLRYSSDNLKKTVRIITNFLSNCT